MSQPSSTVFLVSQVSSQLQLMVDCLRKILSSDCTITMQQPESQSLTHRPFQHSIVLLDADCMNMERMQHWHPDQERVKRATVAAFNVQDTSQAYELVTGLKLRGIFYRNDSLEMFCRGIKALQNGEFWMSRSLMAQVVETYQRQQQYTFRTANGLTQRELQILSMLSAGANNQQIAKHLFVSLHTVKSHLYKTFRKLDVHNRVEAINWFHQHFGMPPPIELIVKRENTLEETVPS